MVLADHDAKLAQATKDQATEGDHLGKLKEEADRAQASHAQLISKKTTWLEARKKTFAIAKKAVDTGHEAFVALEPRSCTVLHSLYGEGYEKPLVTLEDGLAGLLPKLAEALEGVDARVDSMVERECRTLFTTTAMLVFSHLHLRETSFDLSALIESVAPESRDATAEAVKKLVEALLEKFLYVPEPAAGATGADDEDGGGAIVDRLRKARDSGGQSDGSAPSSSLQQLSCLMEA